MFVDSHEVILILAMFVVGFGTTRIFGGAFINLTRFFCWLRARCLLVEANAVAIGGLAVDGPVASHYVIVVGDMVLCNVAVAFAWNMTMHDILSKMLV